MVILLSCDFNFDMWSGLPTHVFGGIINEILHNLYQTMAVSINIWQIGLNISLDLGHIGGRAHKYLQAGFSG